MTNDQNDKQNPDGASEDAASIAEKLSRGQRILFGLIATILSIAGAVAVFITDNQAGSVALLAVGALFGFLSITGVAVEKIKFGDYELALGKVLGELAKKSPAAAAQVAEVVRDVENVAQKRRLQLAQQILSKQDYAGRIVQALGRIAPRHGLSIASLLPEERADFSLQKDGSTIHVLAATDPVPYAQQANLALGSMKLKGLLGRVLLVGKEATGPGTAKSLSDHGVKVVQWQSIEDDAALEEGLQELLTQDSLIVEERH